MAREWTKRLSTQELVLSPEANTALSLREAQDPHKRGHPHRAERLTRRTGDVLAVASHELRSPLATLKLLFQSSLMTLRKDSEHPAYDQVLARLERGEREVTRLTRYVEVLLDASQLVNEGFSLKLELLDLGALLQEAMARHVAIHGSSGVVLLHSTQPLMGNWDRLRIEQVLTNLFSNASKYGGEGGFIVEAHAQEGQACICVRDRGLGISVSDQARIFERWERGSWANGIEGLGLGLWIAQSIVEAHGGRITVESGRGEGTEFRVMLPLARRDDEGPAAPSSEIRFRKRSE